MLAIRRRLDIIMRMRINPPKAYKLARKRMKKGNSRLKYPQEKG